MMDWFSRHNMFSVKLIPVSANPWPTIAGEDHAILFNIRPSPRHYFHSIRSAKRHDGDGRVWHMELRQFARHDAGDCGRHRSNHFCLVVMAQPNQESMG